MLLLLIGIQFRMVHSFRLNEPTTRTLQRVMKVADAEPTPRSMDLMMRVHPHPTKTVTPPRWLGLGLLTIGAVVTLHALAMPRYDG